MTEKMGELVVCVFQAGLAIAAIPFFLGVVGWLIDRWVGPLEPDPERDEETL